MDLSPEQQSQVASWIARGDSLAEVQRLLESEFGRRMTYMDVRFLIDDLSLDLPEKEAPANPVDATLEPKPAIPEKVTVVVDKITRPGALVSGTVTFTDGKSAQWMLDQMGRLGLDGVDADYRPPGDDLTAFQTELQAELRKAGYA